MAERAIRESLDKLLASPGFRQSDRLSRFLRYVVEEALAGRGDAIKEYAVGIEVFDKKDGYDPAVDSTVRSEASKLRMKLRLYYETEGRADPVVISLPKGSYRPRFDPRARSSQPWLPVSAVLLIAAVGAVSWALRGRSVRTPRLTRVTSEAGFAAYPALSPDGKLVVYASDRAGRGDLDLWIQPVGSQTATRLTDDPSDDIEPDFSPDGSRIAFRSNRKGGGIYVLPVLGGDARLVANQGHRPRFSPDGSHIAYSTGTWRFFASTPGSGKLFVAPSDGGSPHQIQPGFSAAHYPVWTPDGRHILFLGRSVADVPTTESYDWWVTPVPAGNAVKTDALQKFRAAGLSAAGWPRVAWLPSGWIGNSVLFSAGSGDSTNLWRIPISPDTWRSEEPQRVTLGPGPDNEPAVTSDGVIAISNATANVELWEVPLDRVHTPRKIVSSAEDEMWPSLSADGSILVYRSVVAGKSAVFVHDFRSGQATRLSPESEGADWPEISRSGDSVIYRRNDRSPWPAILKPLTGGPTRELCTGCQSLHFSRDTSKFLYATMQPPISIRLRDAASGSDTEFLSDPPYQVYQPLLSPDDRWVLFYARLDLERSRVYAVPFRGGKPPVKSDWIAVTDGEHHDTTPLWSPDGGTVFFASSRDGFHCVWARRFDRHAGRAAGDIFPVSHWHAAARQLGNVGVSARGMTIAAGKLVVPVTEISGTVWLMR